jgi:hypothetical protein
MPYSIHDNNRALKFEQDPVFADSQAILWGVVRQVLNIALQVGLERFDLGQNPSALWQGQV